MGRMIVEVADHRGRIRSRIRLPAEGASIGRGYGNDVIVDDPYADPVHLRVGPGDDGSWQFVDQGSVNGTWDAAKHRRLTAGPVSNGLELRIGRSLVRFMAVETPVPPALVDAPARFGVASLLNLRTSALVLTLAALTWGVVRFFGSTEAVSPLELLTPGLATMLVGAIWAGGWAFTNRVVAQRFRFLAHLAWTMLVATTVLVLGAVAEWIEFFTPSVDLTWLERLGSAGLAAILLVGHFELLTEWSQRRRWAVASAVTLVLMVIVAMFEGAAGSLGSDAGSEPVGPLKPISSRLIPGTTLERFFDRTNRLKGAVDELADSL